MWVNNKLESLTESLLKKETELLSAEELWDGYDALKKHLCKIVLPNIARSEPTLTDHSEKHIQDVQRNIFKIIEHKQDKFNATEIFFLSYASLIHDIGNIFGREGHAHKAKEIIRDFPMTIDAVKRISTQIAKAHGGKGDTIGKLDQEIPYDNFPIKGREIASIIRFADECAEGEQRCYLFGLENKLIKDDISILHHLYSKVITFYIDRNSINLNYHLSLKYFKTINELEIFLKFIFERINKTNRERLYCSHYSEFISQYNSIKVNINFAEDDIDESFENISFTLNNMSMLECTSNPAESENRIAEILSFKTIKKYYKIKEEKKC